MGLIIFPTSAQLNSQIFPFSCIDFFPLLFIIRNRSEPEPQQQNSFRIIFILIPKMEECFIIMTDSAAAADRHRRLYITF